MRFIETYLNWLVGVAVFVAVIVVSAHYIHAYERMTAKRPDVTVTIPEGSTVYDIDRILAEKGVLPRGQFIAAAQGYEGELFPDTYNFYLDATATSVIQKCLDTFGAKAQPLLAADPHGEQDLIIASMVQKEVASSTDMAIVAGILEKRLAAGMFLNVDATICYAKQVAAPTSTQGCYPLTAADLKLASPYNTYLHTGLPPTPIGNPGVAAIEATLHPATSSYWYYLSDSKTGETIYAKTLDEQLANQKKYL